MTVSHSKSKTEHFSPILLQTSEPATLVGSALSHCTPSIDDILYTGIPVHKVSDDGSLSRRIFALSRSNFLLFLRSPSSSSSSSSFSPLHRVVKDTWKSWTTNGKDTFIDIADVTHIFRGFVGTRRLEKCTAVVKANRREDEEAKILSIVYGDFNTLDLVLPQSTMLV